MHPFPAMLESIQENPSKSAISHFFLRTIGNSHRALHHEQVGRPQIQTNFNLNLL
jgi:hypothetical protein